MEARKEDDRDEGELVRQVRPLIEQAEKIRTTSRAKAERIRTQADERIAALHAQAETDADEHEHRAEVAVGRMLKFGETPKSIADTLGVMLAHIREIQRSVSTLADGKG